MPPEKDPPRPRRLPTPSRWSRRCHALLDRRDALARQTDDLRRALARYAPFGEFDLEEVRGLAGAGVWTGLVVAPPDERLAAPEGTALTELGHDRGGRYCLLAASGELPDPLPDLGGHFDLVPWPARPLATVRAELAACEQEIADAGERLEALAASRDGVRALVRETADETRFAEVRAGMDETDELSVLSGYVPAETQDAVRAAAAAHGWGILLDDPRPGDDVPVDLRQAGWVRPIRAVFDFLNIYPGYWEWDVGWVFLPFFSLFFAMIVGDAGYAVLLLALTAVLQWRLKKVPAPVFHMMYIAGGRDARVGRAQRQLLRYPHAAAASPSSSRWPGSRTATTSSTCASSSALCTSRSRIYGTRRRSSASACGARCRLRRAGSSSSGRCSSSRGRRCSDAPCPSTSCTALAVEHPPRGTVHEDAERGQDGVDRPAPCCR